MNEPRPAWSRERQPEPPNFGQAQLVSRARLEAEARWRRLKARRSLRRANQLFEYEPGLVSLVVLAYRRLPELKRLCDTLVPFFQRTEDYRPVEKILVDNGSGLPELSDYVHGLGFFDEIRSHEENLGMPPALDDAFRRCRGEYVLFVEDDFVLDYDRPFLRRAIGVLTEYPEIGIVRLKNQNNWWKPFRRIGPIRTTTDGTEFWTWLPSRDGAWNVWAAGSVLFRRASFFATGALPSDWDRAVDPAGGAAYEIEYGRRYNSTWLAAKINRCQPFVQPNDNPAADPATAAGDASAV